MFQYLGYLMFILSVAMTAGGIVLSTRLRNKYHNNIFSLLLYYQVFIYAFGFYGIWGQAVITALLSGYITYEQLTRFSYIAMLLGLPFLVFGWLMLLHLSSALSGRNSSKFFTPFFLLINFSILVTVGYFISSSDNIRPVFVIKSYYITLNFLYSTLASIIILIPGRRRSIINPPGKKIISAAIFWIMVIQTIPLLFYKTELWIAVIFILIFFAGNTFLPVYFNYGLPQLNLNAEPVKDLTFEEFCKRFEVSPRETDIIREICNGLSNKEISEKLFITLQTVKDHTHRIYTKTNVRSRAQLITLVQDLRLL